MSKDVSVLILSCDSYTDVWPPFFTLFHRYWDCKYPVYIALETAKCPYAITLNHSYPLSWWTRRIYDTVQDLSTEYVLMMDGDYFFRNKVDQERIDFCLDHFDSETVMFNFEPDYGSGLPSDIPGFHLKQPWSTYKCSCQASLWNRKKLLSLLQLPLNPWQWEDQMLPNSEKFYINSGPLVFDYGYHYGIDGFGLFRGKWVKSDVVPLFEKEGITVDYSIRGFC